ncbi:TPA: NTTRR-F1 domain, partial [Bacillus anthracis]|nr:NTTRR-F1 domain [Bacillus anthracis]
MSINELIVNGSFESGSFFPWVPINATITSEFSHSGFFAARLTGGTVNSYIFQTVPIDSGENFKFIVSLAKIGTLPSPPVTISVSYYDEGFNFIEYGLITNIPANRIPSLNGLDWLEVYQTTSPAPLGATQAFVLVNSLPQSGSADIVVDDVSLLAVEGIGTGPAGPTGPTGATGPAGVTGATGATGP